jgi:hypothetical protein
MQVAFPFLFFFCRGQDHSRLDREIHSETLFRFASHDVRGHFRADIHSTIAGAKGASLVVGYSQQDVQSEFGSARL